MLFCVKLWDVETAGELIRPIVGPETAVIALQNGIDAGDRLISILGSDAVMGGVAVGSGAVVSRSIGRLSLTYAQSQQSKVEAVADDKESTSYGREYLALVGANFSGPLIV